MVGCIGTRLKSEGKAAFGLFVENRIENWRWVPYRCEVSILRSYFNCFSHRAEALASRFDLALASVERDDNRSRAHHQPRRAQMELKAEAHHISFTASSFLPSALYSRTA